MTNEAPPPPTPGEDTGSGLKTTTAPVSVMPDGRRVVLTDSKNADGYVYFLEVEPLGDASLFEQHEIREVSPSSGDKPPVVDLCFNDVWTRLVGHVDPYCIPVGTDPPSA